MNFECYPSKFLKILPERFTLKPSCRQTIYLKAYSTHKDEFTCLIQGLRIWLSEDCFCDHYLDRRGNSYFINMPDFQLNKIEPFNSKPFTIDLENIKIEKPHPKI